MKTDTLKRIVVDLNFDLILDASAGLNQQVATQGYIGWVEARHNHHLTTGCKLKR